MRPAFPSNCCWVPGRDKTPHIRPGGVLPHLLKAARVKRLELQRRKCEDQIAELDEQRTEGYQRLEAAREERRKAAEEETAAYGMWHDANWRIESYERRVREIADIKGES